MEDSLQKALDEAVKAEIKKKELIPVEFIKEAIRSDMAQVEQWKKNYDWAENVVKYYHKLEALVELLEVHNCGSIGGFDIGQDNCIRHSLDERAEYVLDKRA